MSTSTPEGSVGSGWPGAPTTTTGPSTARPTTETVRRSRVEPCHSSAAFEDPIREDRPPASTTPAVLSTTSVMLGAIGLDGGATLLRSGAPSPVSGCVERFRVHEKHCPDAGFAHAGAVGGRGGEVESSRGPASRRTRAAVARDGARSATTSHRPRGGDQRAQFPASTTSVPTLATARALVVTSVCVVMPLGDTVSAHVHIERPVRTTEEVRL